MSISEALTPTKEHIIKAREMAKYIHSLEIEQRIEVLKEIPQQVIRIAENEIKRVKDLK